MKSINDNQQQQKREYLMCIRLVTLKINYFKRERIFFDSEEIKIIAN